MNKKYYDSIADLMLFAVNFTEGDNLLISLDADCREAVRSLAYKAYEKGAAYVGMRYNDDFLHAAAIKAGKTSIDYPEYLKRMLDDTCVKGWKSIAYLSFSETDTYKDLPGDVSAEYFRNYQKLTDFRRTQSMDDAYPWSLTFIPTAATAKAVFPESSTEDAYKAYWEEVIRIMRLDREDPVAAWKEKFRKDVERKEYLSGLSAEYLEFRGPGTDLRLRLNPNAAWCGGQEIAKTGDVFAPNMPTDEIFTIPDCGRVDGRVALTRPLVMAQNLGSVPRNAWFEFKDGKVVDYGADDGKDSLDNFFARDDRARYLGEVALVDPSSTFAQSGRTFYNGLYDENTSCHIALGASYTAALKVPGHYSREQLLEMGMNQASVHEDMMIGGPGVDVTAVSSDGTRVGIIKNGKFLI